MKLRIVPANLNCPELIALVETHKALMLEHSPPESSHALLMDGLRAPDIQVYTLFDGEKLIGCGALKTHSAELGEIKSMHTLASRRGEGLGRKMLVHLIAQARAQGLQRLSLETGSQKGFLAARQLYESMGFVYCGPFGAYQEDSNSVFMTAELTPPSSS